MADARYDRSALTDELTERQKVVLVRIMEESAELSQACAKTLRWGLESSHPRTGQTNAAAIQEEFDDVCRFVGELLL